MIETIKVKLHGETYFWLKDSDGTGPLAYPDHVDDKGDIASLHTALFKDSFAHVCDGGIIKRYRKTIGHVDDLEFL